MIPEPIPERDKKTIHDIVSSNNFPMELLYEITRNSDVRFVPLSRSGCH